MDCMSGATTTFAENGADTPWAAGGDVTVAAASGGIVSPVEGPDAAAGPGRHLVRQPMRHRPCRRTSLLRSTGSTCPPSILMGLKDVRRLGAEGRRSVQIQPEGVAITGEYTGVVQPPAMNSILRGGRMATKSRTTSWYSLPLAIAVEAAFLAEERQAGRAAPAWDVRTAAAQQHPRPRGRPARCAEEAAGDAWNEPLLRTPAARQKLVAQAEVVASSERKERCA